jgi:two-component system, sensor histidine kinase and response regulator
MSDVPLVDAAILDELIGHIGDEAAHAVIELFIGECRDLAATIGAPETSRDQVRRAAHSLKSSAGQLGASALAQAALDVETAAEHGAPELRWLITNLLEFAARTETALGARLAG